MSKSLQNIIAKAIHKSDRTYFFENYDRQADAVLKALHKQGYAIVPLEPSETMVEQGVAAIPFGNIKPDLHVRQVYQAMAKAEMRPPVTVRKLAR